MDIKLYSYLFGLFGTDGSVRRNYDNTHINSLSIELIDKDILDKIAQQLSNCTQSERIRDTNFKKNAHHYYLYCNNKQFILWLQEHGMPLMDKTNSIAAPSGEYSEPDFWRGVIDGDGSLGMKTVEQQPFISLVTKSAFLKNDFIDFIYRNTGFKPICNRNQRDDVFNITLHGEKALKIASILYEDASIYIDRKYNTYLQIRNWKKKNMKGVVRKKWTEQEVQDLKRMDMYTFHDKYPERTLVAIRGKRQKLKQKGELDE